MVCARQRSNAQWSLSQTIEIGVHRGHERLLCYTICCICRLHVLVVQGWLYSMFYSMYRLEYIVV
jgi:hypothetical protein